MGQALPRVSQSKEEVAALVLKESHHPQVDDSGKVQRLRKVCPTCGEGTFMATHFNRMYW